MRCLHPKTVGFKADGKTLSHSQKTHSKEFATFLRPCGKCRACLLETARQSAVRCVHHAMAYGDNNCFITLTYNDEHLGNNTLNRKDWQNFIKALRNHVFDQLLEKLFPGLCRKAKRKLWKELSQDEQKRHFEPIKISTFHVGEYGEKHGRKHWHALIFNWRPTDGVHKYTSAIGDQVFSSETIDSLWKKGITEFGSVTFKSAGYCARYTLKKSKNSEKKPISGRSSRYGIGKEFLEKYWKEIFHTGSVQISGKKSGIPRYYEKWLKKTHPQEFEKYLLTIKRDQLDRAYKMEEKRNLEEAKANFKRQAIAGLQKRLPTRVQTLNETNKIILNERMKKLNQGIKL